MLGFQQTLGATQEEPDPSFLGYVHGIYHASPVAFGVPAPRLTVTALAVPV